jgi:AAA15 family ATPase/GTPase
LIELKKNTVLIDFTVGNLLSFQDKVTLSLEAASITELEETNVIEVPRLRLLKGTVVYGANGSGKSNLIRAMSVMRRVILESSSTSSTTELDIVPFLLNVQTRSAPSFFEITIQLEDRRYRYGFEIDKRLVHREWLYEAAKSTEKPLFLREKDGIEVRKSFPEGKDLEEKTRDNALFLAVADQFNGPVAKKIMSWFQRFLVISGLRHEDFETLTYEMISDLENSTALTDFLWQLDLGFGMLALSDTGPISTRNGGVKADPYGRITTYHQIYNQEGETEDQEEFDLRTQESAGTNKIFNLSGPIFQTLRKGGVLVVDELDSSLHPLLTQAIIRQFHSGTMNPEKAQLIFSTHDTNLLQPGIFRRDQVYFVEKDAKGASDVYSLVEYKEEGKTIRKDRSFEKDYIAGRYGAIPIIGGDIITNIHG